MYLVLLICLAGIVLGIGPRLIDEDRRLGAAMPGLIDKFTQGRSPGRIAEQALVNSSVPETRENIS